MHCIAFLLSFIALFSHFYGNWQRLSEFVTESICKSWQPHKIQKNKLLKCFRVD